MESNNETVEQVADKVFKRIQMSRERDKECGHLWTENELKIRRVLEDNVEDYCTRFLAAHKREIEMIAEENESLQNKYLNSQWKVGELARKIEAKDAEIARLVNIINTECNKCGDCAKFGGDCSAGDVDGNEDCRACSRFESNQIASLRVLVKELTDALEHRIDCECSCENCTMPKCTNKRCRELVAKAREDAK